MKKLITIIALAITVTACDKDNNITDVDFATAQLQQHGYVEISIHTDIHSGCPLSFSHGYAFTANRHESSRRITLGSICWSNSDNVKVFTNKSTDE